MREDRKVDLIVLDDALEAVAIRSMLESFGIEVRCRFIGNVKALISLLEGKELLHKIVVLCCHGVDEGMVVPELAEALEKEMPYRRVLKASDFAQFLSLKNQIVITTGCCLGKESFAQSFLQGGAAAYLGLKTYGEGSAALFFVVSFLYFYLSKGVSIEEAFAKAQTVEDADLFTLYINKFEYT